MLHLTVKAWSELFSCNYSNIRKFSIIIPNFGGICTIYCNCSPELTSQENLNNFPNLRGINLMHPKNKYFRNSKNMIF